jgi:DNA modification methylase
VGKIGRMLKFIKAKTHSPEYLLHKYWARKPYNVLSEILLDEVTDKPITVLDPFCGSGVFLREAAKLGFNGYGFDVNPVAFLLSKVTCNPPNPTKFQEVIEPIIEEFSERCLESYQSCQGSLIRYVVHEISILCDHCSIQLRVSQSRKNGRIYRCHSCDKRVHFNLKKMVSTKAIGIQTEREFIEYPGSLELQDLSSQEELQEWVFQFNFDFVENKRILAHKGLKTNALFTHRNFNLVCWLAQAFHSIADLSIKEVALLLLTASVAQSSRLIAYRNRLTTGGPAWSVPGYWVPPIHLETNPRHHILARYRKFMKGLEALRSHKTSSVKIFNENSKMIPQFISDEIDLVFLDPPYGDSIPYLEFSMLWNSFLKAKIDLEDDISVSDRMSMKTDSWEKYSDSLNKILSSVSSVLSKNGKILITFNNHDQKAWFALIKALQTNDFYCTESTYQIPAVIPSKAQFSPSGSYVSDIYSFYKKSITYKFLFNFETVIESVVKNSLYRENKLTKTQLYRSIFISIIVNNIHYSLFPKIDDFIDLYFSINSEGVYSLKDQMDMSGESL